MFRVSLHGTPFKPGKRAFHAWHRMRKGDWWVQLKAGHTVITLNNGVLFKAGKELSDVLSFYDMILECMEEGKLDEALRDAMKRRERA